MSTRPPEIPLAEGSLLGGKYLLGPVIGRGGMGIVMAATHLELGSSVAVKFLLPHAVETPEAVERFLREARAAASLRSQHVVRVYDVARLESGLPYIVMEQLEGTDLATLVRDKHPLPWDDVASFVLQACDALEEAHSRGIVHRDLKPANLFLTRHRNGSPIIKILDFGISKVTADALLEGALTRTGEMVGSPLYMSPEQVRAAREVDARTDIWSVGVVLYELLAGRVPFHATTLPRLCAMVLEEQPPSLGALRPDLPPELCAVIESCLRKNPSERPADVKQLRQALEEVIRSQQSVPRPSRSPAAKQPRIRMGAALALLSALVIVAFGAWAGAHRRSSDPQPSWTGMAGPSTNVPTPSSGPSAAPSPQDSGTEPDAATSTVSEPGRTQPKAPSTGHTAKSAGSGPAPGPRQPPAPPAGNAPDPTELPDLRK